MGDSHLYKDPLQELTRCAIELPSLLAQAKTLMKQERRPESLRGMSDLIEKAYELQNIMTQMPLELNDKW